MSKKSSNKFLTALLFMGGAAIFLLKRNTNILPTSQNFDVGRFRLGKINFRGFPFVELKAYLRIYNYSGLPLRITGVQGSITSKGKQIAVVNSNKVQTLSPYAQGDLGINISFNLTTLLDPATNLYDQIANGDLDALNSLTNDISIEGAIHSGIVKVNFQERLV